MPQCPSVRILVGVAGTAPLHGLILREAFQALVLGRMVIRQEQTYKGATWVTYVNSPDGRAALERGDVADVVARRLPD